MKQIQIVYPGESFVKFQMDSDLPTEDLLEQIFHEWNHGSRLECELFKVSQTRSLSVNDFVEIDGNWYQCASVGWRPVTKQFVDEIYAEVNQHPSFKEHGGWFATDAVMRKFNF